VNLSEGNNNKKKCIFVPKISLDILVHFTPKRLVHFRAEWVVHFAPKWVVHFVRNNHLKVGKKKKAEKYTAQALENTVLKDFITTSKDSTYLAFAFTYTCPHCLNSIANLKEYEQLGVVDKVIGLAVGDSVINKEFADIFNPNFPIRNHSKEELRQLTKTFPKAYYIRNDSVIMEVSGVLPCAYLFNSSRD